MDTTVGQFRIEDEIGKGSFATVYRGVEKVCFELLYEFCSLTMLSLYHND